MRAGRRFVWPNADARLTRPEHRASTVTVSRTRRGSMRKFALTFTLIFVLAAAATGTASASTSVLYGVQDDAWLRYDDYGPSLTERVLTLKQMGVGIVRYTVRWDEV